MALDLLKQRSDDAYYTEEHIIFLAQKMRAFLLERKYRGSRNQSFVPVNPENMQHVCIPVEPTTLLPNGCGGHWLKSKDRIPQFMNIMEPRLAAGSDMIHTTLTFIPPERMPYVGHNKWLKNIIYVTRNMQGYIYLTSQTPQFIHLEKFGLEAVFSDPEAASKFSCDCDDMNNCDILDRPFPLEQDLVVPCIEMIVQELAGPQYMPEDKVNNAKDDLGGIGVQRRGQRRRSRDDDNADEE